MKKNGKKVVVTGGAGFIGSHLVDALVEREYEVHVIDNLSGGKKENVNPQATLHVADICDYEAIAPIIAGAQYVFHLAALPRVQYSIEYPSETNEVNVGGTINVLKAAQKGGVKRFIYSASSSAYGDQPRLPLTEDMTAMPKSPYGLQKYIGELYARMLRYFNIYGPRYNAEGAYALVIGKFLEQRRHGEPMTITGDGKQTRDFTSVTDAVSANIIAAEHLHEFRGEVFNIGAGNNYSVNQVAEFIGGPVVHIPARLEPRDTRADNSKAKRELGWSPEVKLPDGIAELKKIVGIL
ncbi:MAG: NAD-dependent epimerase/dehydratase family protein [Candidatus Lloydbacteria bacterium]|nr:NAD-dependent epimerase/dehydratase family protein [Candidatus Lloydbacteria bacterium]